MDSFKSLSVSSYSVSAGKNVKVAIKECNVGDNLPIIVCVGSDLILGDSLGPLVGTLLRQNGVGAYVYGTLNAPITAREVDYVKTYLKKIHKNSKIIAIDAGIGPDSDVGLIKIRDVGLKPGLGVDKELPSLGDMSIVGVVASKSIRNVNLFNYTRLNLVYKMATVIAEGIIDYINDLGLLGNSACVS